MAFFEIDPTRSYATKGRAITAANQILKAKGINLRFTVFKYTGPEANHDGRWIVVFVGSAAIDHGMHFHFNCVA